ncbi:hypothetical protein EJC47_19750 [Sphingomonas sp. TF3]|uniref:baseplate J/gp47 family protein n=1 Tax=Sphingomonas sp. TF3 TaxID=2495580 RepID=UPI000F891011|nr:baseplate J/gp47 family protein [Sphingomonas sp. TF3]RUN74792.1 hypothetical protein EJC47_19750 [Sphingomonas sp. TF3]
MDDINQALADLPAIDASVLNSSGSGPYGMTDAGYLPKPYARLVAEGLANARALMGADVDAGQGSVIRKLIEMTAIEHARLYTLVGSLVDDLTIPTARGEGLDRLGGELGLPRPFATAAGQVTLKFKGAMPPGVTELVVPVGARMLTTGGHHVATTQSARLTAAVPNATVTAEAFYPGPEHDLDPANAAQKIKLWNADDEAIEPISAIASIRGPGTALEAVVDIVHDKPFTGGAYRWPDDRYRSLLLRAPRSLWSARGIELAASLVPGVRQVKVIDLYGGLDIDMAIFGNFNFAERVFGSERNLVTPYLFTILVAPTAAAIWSGPDGLAAQIADTIEDLRPVGIFPEIREASEVYVGVRANLVIEGIPLPSGDRATVNASAPALAFKQRLLERCRGYVDRLEFGEQVSPAKISWALMSEPGVVDVRDLRLLRYPLPPSEIDFAGPASANAVDLLGCGEAAALAGNQIAQFIDNPTDLTII